MVMKLLIVCALLSVFVVNADHTPQPHYTKLLCEYHEGIWNGGKCFYSNGVICYDRICYLSDRYFGLKNIKV